MRKAKRNKIWLKDLVGSRSRKAHKRAKVEKEVRRKPKDETITS